MANPTIPGGEVFPFFGSITYYNFNATISKSTTSLKIQNSYTEPVNTQLFVVPSLTFKSGSQFLVRAAVSCSPHVKEEAET
jgi:hypothetical protein